jgi:hypothetical protein
MGRRGAKAANAAQGLDAADAGHVHVEQDGVEGRGAQQLQRLFAARGLGDLKAKFHQRGAQRPADGDSSSTTRMRMACWFIERSSSRPGREWPRKTWSLPALRW